MPPRLPPPPPPPLLCTFRRTPARSDAPPGPPAPRQLTSRPFQSPRPAGRPAGGGSGTPSWLRGGCEQALAREGLPEVRMTVKSARGAHQQSCFWQLCSRFARYHPLACPALSRSRRALNHFKSVKAAQRQVWSNSSSFALSRQRAQPPPRFFRATAAAAAASLPSTSLHCDPPTSSSPLLNVFTSSSMSS